MKQVKSKITGDIGELDFDSREGVFIVVCYDLNTKETVKSYYKSLEDLCEEWCDYEEPKGIKSVDNIGNSVHIEFGTKEEAKLAVERLRAWKRLKDKGFKFGGWKRDKRFWGDYTIEAQDYITCDDKDLDLLFGGEE